MISFAKEKPFSVEAAAKYMGVHRRTIEAWFRLGLESRRIRRRVFTTLEAIDRFSEAFLQRDQADSSAALQSPRQSRKEALTAARELDRRHGRARIRKMEVITNGAEARHPS